MYEWNYISNNKVNTILKEKQISIKSLTGYGNLGLKKKDLKSYKENEKCSIKLKDYYVTLFKINSCNSFWVNCFHSSLNWMYLSLLGFSACYLLLFIFTMYTLLIELFMLLWIKLWFSSCTFQEIDWLLFSNFW